jgi:hypothetical protein
MRSMAGVFFNIDFLQKGQPVRNDDLKIVCSDDFNLALLK